MTKAVRTKFRAGGLDISRAQVAPKGELHILTRLVAVLVAFNIASVGLAQQQSVTDGSVVKVIGTVERATARTIEVKLDSGVGATVIIRDSTVLQRLPYGGSLKDARTITLAEIHVGDRILARGTAEQNGATIIADRVVTVDHADLNQGQQRDRDGWEKRGVSGVVTAINPSRRSITISHSGNKTVISVSDTTKILRYSDTGKFEDAKRSTLDEIAIGDLVRVRGELDINRNSVVAEEVVFGVCRSDYPDCRP
jgi:hypothetical protein